MYPNISQINEVSIPLKIVFCVIQAKFQEVNFIGIEQFCFLESH